MVIIFDENKTLLNDGGGGRRVEVIIINQGTYRHWRRKTSLHCRPTASPTAKCKLEGSM